MRLLLVFEALIAVVTASKFEKLVQLEWETHKLTHNLTFKNATEDRYRMDIYVDNRIIHAEHNAKFARGEVTFAVGVNPFTHMLNQEVNDIMNGYNRAERMGINQQVTSPRPKSTFVPTGDDVPDETDWREMGAVTPIKNQKSCGSCYAFSATGALEGQLFVKTGKLVSLSEQNILDCSKSEGNDGCLGGIMDHVFQYIADNDGIDTEESYPYTGTDSDICQYCNETKGATDTGFIDIPAGDEDALKEAVATIGPISVGIDAGLLTYQNYKYGVYYDPSCSSERLNHGVLVVGYGTTSDGQDYWVVKNTWGEAWGDDGYIMMARNMNNHCGIATRASFPTGVQ